MSILDENKHVEFLQGWIGREARWWATRWTLTRRWTRWTTRERRRGQDVGKAGLDKELSKYVEMKVATKVKGWMERWR